MNDSFLPGTTNIFATGAGSPGGKSPSGGRRSDAPLEEVDVSAECRKRIMREAKKLLKDPHPNWDVYMTDNLLFWRLILEVEDPHSDYAGGTFEAYIRFSSRYPEQAPEVRFATSVRHCNINAHGKVCHSVFGRNYTPDTSVRDLLDNVYGLFIFPDLDDPLDSHLQQVFYDDEDHSRYRKTIRDAVRKHASRSRKEWAARLKYEEA